MGPRATEIWWFLLVGAVLVAAGMLGSGCAQILGIEDLSQQQVDAAQLPIDAPGSGDMDADNGSGNRVVRGTASGLLGSVALELRLGNDVELLTVMQDGEFAFETVVEDGISYAVVLVDPRAPCTLRNDTGVISGVDAVVELVCTGASLASIVVSGIAPAVPLTPETDDYVIDLPLSQPSVTLTATATTTGDTLTIAGSPAESGTSTAPITLALGDNSIEISVENVLGWQRAYRLNLRRADQLAQYAYGKASNIGDGDQFGTSLVIAGDTLAIGAPFEDSGATGIDKDQDDDDNFANSGAVYVFRRLGAIWQQEAYVKASNTGPGDNFGVSVALSGDTLAVGAPGEDSAAIGINGNQTSNAAGDGGAAYVFRRTDTGWVQEAYVKASNTGSNDRFGTSVALSGDTLAVGATGESSSSTGVGGIQTDNSRPASGAVYLFSRSGNEWQQEAYVKSSNTGVADVFGTSLSLSGDTLAVAAPREDSDATGVGGDEDNDVSRNSGALYIFRRSGAVWVQEAYIKAVNTGDEDEFGTTVAVSGDVLAVGAPLEDSGATGVGSDPFNDAAPNSGAVYVFRRSGTTWQQEAYIKATNTGVDDQFGSSVALSDGSLAVGAPLEDSGARGVDGSQNDNSALQSGAVYIFRHTGTEWEQSDYIKASNTGTDDNFGASVTVSSNTIVGGAYLEQGGDDGQDGDSAPGSGAVYVFH